MFTARWRDERGAALIVAMAVAFVVMILSTVVIAQAIHNTEQSAQNRRRLTSVNGAEAGLNHFYNYLENTEADELLTTPQTAVVGGAPGTTEYVTTPTFYADEEGTVPFTGSPSANNYPRSVHLESVGTTNDGNERTMESFVVLTPIYGGLTGAVVTNSSTAFNNNFTINGNNGNDGDVYVLNGNFSAPSGLETIKGDIYVTGGTALIGTNLHLHGELWASGNVTINHAQADVDLDVKSGSGSVTASNGNVDGSAYYCTGSAPGSVVKGQKINSCVGPPPTQAFPQIKYVQSAWEDEGYQILTPFTGATACTDARNYVEGAGAGTFQGGAGVPSPYTGAVVYIDATCTYTSSNNVTVTLGKDLAILTEGSIDFSQRSTWNGSGSTKQLHIMSPWPAAGSPVCPTQNISFGNNTSFNSLVETFVYSPCTLTMNNNNSAFQGQVIGQTVSIGNLFNMTYKPILVPGAEVIGFEQDIAYIREVS